MGKLNKIFKTRYKIVPTYTKDNKINGYVPLSKIIIGWAPLLMYQFDEDGKKNETEAYFKTYEDAIDFVRYEEKILTDDEIFGTGLSRG